MLDMLTTGTEGGSIIHVVAEVVSRRPVISRLIRYELLMAANISIVVL
jgi:hypothetical protein